MWLLSMPSFVIMCVSVVFYAASIVLHIAQRKHEDNIIDVATVSQDIEINRVGAGLAPALLSSQNVIDVIDNYNNTKFQKNVTFDFTEGFSIVHCPLSIVHYSSASVFYSGTWWEHNSRPPPIV